MTTNRRGNSPKMRSLSRRQICVNVGAMIEAQEKLMVGNRMAAVCVCLLAIWSARAQDSATQPAAPDQSSAKSAALAFARALEANDLVAAKAASNASNPGEERFVTSLAELFSSMKRMKTAAEGRFGAGAAEFAGPEMRSDFSVTVNEAVASESGDTASLKRGDLAPLLGGAPVEPVAANISAMARTFGEMADEISAGKLATPADAKQAMDRKLMTLQAALAGAASAQPSNPPTTQPGEPPTTQPGE